jgi:branched-chain amino acid transport system substrate-binding protein
MKRSAYVSRRLVAAVACVAVAATVTACGSSDDGGGSGGGGDSSEAAGAPSKNEIVFGAMLPVTGDYAPFTKPAIFANNIAIEEINADGGVLGKKVKLVIDDTKSTAEAAVPAFDRLTEVSKSTVLGVGDSDAAIAVLDAIAEKQLPTMCPYCGADALTPGGGEWVYRLSPADGQLGIAAAQFARDHDYTKAAILGQKTDASISAVESFKKPFTEKLGGDLCEEVMFDPGKSSYQAEVQKAFSCDPQVVWATTGTEAGIPIMREWARRGYGGKWLLSQDMLTPDIAKSTPELEGNAFGPTGSMDTSTPAYESFAEKYKEKSGGNEPSDGLWEAASFDQWIMAALAIEKAKSTEGAKIAAAVPEIANAPGTKCYRYKECLDLVKKGEDIDYYGASGANDLNDDGDLASPRFTTTELTGGEFVSGEAFNLDPSLTK